MPVDRQHLEFHPFGLDGRFETAPGYPPGACCGPFRSEGGCVPVAHRSDDATQS